MDKDFFLESRMYKSDICLNPLSLVNGSLQEISLFGHHYYTPDWHLDKFFNIQDAFDIILNKAGRSLCFDEELVAWNISIGLVFYMPLGNDDHEKEHKVFKLSVREWDDQSKEIIKKGCFNTLFKYIDEKYSSKENL